MNHGIFVEPNGLPNLLRHSSASSIHNLEIPIFRVVFLQKNERVKAFRKHGNVLCIDNKHDRFGCQFKISGVRNGYGSTRWQPVETKRLVAMDVHGPIHPKQMRTNLVGIAPCKRPMSCKVSASPSKTERFFRTRSATGNKVLDGNCCRNRTWQFKHRSWSCLR